MKTMDAGKWLDSATNKERANSSRDSDYLRPRFATPHKLEGRTIASNGLMAFILHTEIPCEELTDCAYIETVDSILAGLSLARATGEITRYHLEVAARAGLAILAINYKRQFPNMPTLKMYLNGAVVCRADDPENGEVVTEIIDGEAWAEKTVSGKPTRKQKNNPLVKTVPTFSNGYQLFQIARYTHTGEDVELWINPKFLLTALAGLPDIITYKVTDSMLYLCGEVDGILREVVIMGMEKK